MTDTGKRVSGTMPLRENAEGVETGLAQFDLAPTARTCLDERKTADAKTPTGEGSWVGYGGHILAEMLLRA